MLFLCLCIPSPSLRPVLISCISDLQFLQNDVAVFPLKALLWLPPSNFFVILRLIVVSLQTFSSLRAYYAAEVDR